MFIDVFSIENGRDGMTTVSDCDSQAKLAVTYINLKRQTSKHLGSILNLGAQSSNTQIYEKNIK